MTFLRKRYFCTFKEGCRIDWLKHYDNIDNNRKKESEKSVDYSWFCLNFCDEAWCAIFCVLFFGLLSSSLLLLVVTQCFSCCILWPSSGVPCLSRYGNYLKNIKNNLCHWILHFKFILWCFLWNFLWCFMNW